MAALPWEMSPEEVAEDDELTPSQVTEALTFYEAHRAEFDAMLATEQELERACA